VAGIAGGDKAENHKGISLYGLRVFGSAESFDYTDLTYLANAIMTSTLTEPPCDSMPFAYGLHIQNHSYGFSPTGIGGPQENIDLLKDPVHFASRNEVIVVTAAGNTNFAGDSTLNFPASFNGDWVIKVGGSGTALNWHSNAKIGNDLDLVAPYPAEVTFSTNNEFDYAGFGGTSSASPHVAGVAALLLSYNQGLSRDDVEWILKLTADDIVLFPSAAGVDIHTGYGRVNACRALKALESNTIEHFDTDTSPTVFSTDSVETVVLKLTDDYENEAGDVFAPGNYELIVYKITATVSHDLPPGAGIVMGWKRASASTPFGRYKGPGGISGNSLDPFEDLELISYNQDSAVLEGYIYRQVDESESWLPFPLDSVESKAKFAYTLLTGPGVGGEGDECYAITRVSEHPLTEKAFTVFPNPTTDEVNLMMQLKDGVTHLTVDLFDANGRHIKTLFKGTYAGETLRLTDSLATLPTGLYFYRVTTDGMVVAQKVIRQ